MGEVGVVEAGFADAEVGRLGQAVLHDGLGEQVREVEGDVVAAAELEVEQLDLAGVEQHHVAVVRVVVAEHGRPVGQAAPDLGEGLVAVDLAEVGAQRLFVGGERSAGVAEHVARHRAPLVVEELEEAGLGEPARLQLVEPEQLVGHASLDVGVEDVVGGECPAGVERLDPAGVVVVVAVRGDVVFAEEEEGRPLGVEVEDRVLLAGQLAIQDGRRLDRVVGGRGRTPIVNDEKPFGSSKSTSSTVSDRHDGNTSWHFARTRSRTSVARAFIGLLRAPADGRGHDVRPYPPLLRARLTRAWRCRSSGCCGRA